MANTSCPGHAQNVENALQVVQLFNFFALLTYGLALIKLEAGDKIMLVVPIYERVCSSFEKKTSDGLI